MEHKLEAIYYMVKVPLYKFRQCIRPKTDDSTWWAFGDIEYSEEEGATGCSIR